MQIELPDNLGVSETEARLELAVALYARRKISMGRAAELAGVGHLDMQQALAERDIPLNYDEHGKPSAVPSPSQIPAGRWIHRLALVRA